MELTSTNVKSEQLGHLGLVAATIHELGIIEKLDKRLPLNKNKGGIVSYGNRAAAMIINGLGFMNSRLYMTTHFFQDKPIAQLLGSDITAEHLNDDCLGRCLDKIADYGTTQLFSEIAFEIAAEKNLLSQRLHLDTTSFLLYGDYEDEAYKAQSPKPAYGYSKDHRPDLKQVMLSLTQGGAANLPLWMEALDGNSSDKTSFQETVRRVQQFTKKLSQAPDNLFFVVDAAFYVPERLAELDKVKWITRVPSTLNEAKKWMQIPEEEINWQHLDKGYKITSQNITTHHLPQRWVMVFSEQAFGREIKTLHRRMDKQSQILSNQLWHLSNQIFSCMDDAKKAISPVIKKLKYHCVEYQIIAQMKYQGPGRPGPDTQKQLSGYKIEYVFATDLDKVEKYKKTLGRFILATNELNEEVLATQAVLSQYKEQSQVEGGFKFIKDNAFELSSFFLKTPKRIGALMMIMVLCLMVYNFAQFHLRECLKENDDVLPNQLGKPVKNPTMKWIAELMNPIAVVTIAIDNHKQKIVTNVNQVHRKIIAYFGKASLIIYGIPIDYKQINVDYKKYKNLLDWCEK